MQSPAPPSPPASPLHVAAVVAFYMSSALIMIFVNKAVLISSPTLPLLFLFFQMVIAVLLLHLSAPFFSKIELPTRDELNLKKARQLTPVVLVNIIGLIFNTLCLRDVDASFFQIARGLVLPLTICVSSLATHSRPSILVLICATVVTLGFLIGVVPPSLFSASPTTLPVFSSIDAPLHASRAMSLIYGVLSSLFIAFHAVLIKSALPYVDGSTIKLAWWTNAGSAAFLIPFLLLTGEPFRVIEMSRQSVNLAAGDATVWRWDVFVWGSTVTGIFGFLLCIAGLLSIKVTSPITHMFSSAAKGVLQTLLGVLIFRDILTVTRASSISVILFGTVMYTWVKAKETSRAKESVAVPRIDRPKKGIDDES